MFLEKRYETNFQKGIPHFAHKPKKIVAHNGVTLSYLSRGREVVVTIHISGAVFSLKITVERWCWKIEIN